MATLGLLDEDKDPHTGKPALLPSEHRKWERNWKTSDIVPMSGRLVFERINCDGALHFAEHKTFVRLLINDGHMALANRTGELFEHDMTLDNFKGMVKAKREEFGDFRSVCGLDMDGPEGIDFLHQ